jgi:hypothetical protein
MLCVLSQRDGMALEIGDDQTETGSGLLNQDPLSMGNNEPVIVDGHLPRLLDSVGKRLARGTVTSA